MKYSDEIVKEICDFIQGGSSNKDAAALSGIHEDTFYEWVKKYPEFSESLKKAKAKRKARLIALILTSAEKTWQAGAWYLERTEPEEFGRFERLEHTGKGGKAIVVSTPGIDEWLEKKLKEINDRDAKKS